MAGVVGPWVGGVVVNVAGLLPGMVVPEMGLVGIGAGAEVGEEQPINRKMEMIMINNLLAIFLILHLNPLYSILDWWNFNLQLWN